MKTATMPPEQRRDSPLVRTMLAVPNNVQVDCIYNRQSDEEDNA